MYVASAIVFQTAGGTYLLVSGNILAETLFFVSGSISPRFGEKLEAKKLILPSRTCLVRLFSPLK